MKKFILAIFMAVCASGMHAQTEDVDTVNINVEVPSEELSGDNEEQDIKPNLKNSKKMSAPKSKDNFEDMEAMFRRFNAMAMANQQVETKTDNSKIYFPVEGKRKFWRRHHIVQQISISGLTGDDKDAEEEEPTGKVSGEDYQDQQDKHKDGHLGGSIDLSFLLVPGVIEGDNLRINKFGVGYSLGLIAAFDNQKHYGVTCDFLFKLGVETGYAHKMGIGLDALLGTGKSGGISYEISDDAKDDDDIYADPYTKWCLKYGAQLWIRSSLLSSGIANTNVRLFVRYVYSPNPEPDYETYNGGVIINNWMEESWQIGLALCYEF